MGYERHNAIVVTSFDEESIGRAHAAATRIFAKVSTHEGHTRTMVTPTLCSPVNGQHTFLVGPDGSKEGWSTSDVGDEARAEFVEWLDGERHDDGSSPFDWVEVQYGDDCDETIVVAHSDQKKRRRAKVAK